MVLSGGGGFGFQVQNDTVTRHMLYHLLGKHVYIRLLVHARKLDIQSDLPSLSYSFFILSLKGQLVCLIAALEHT